jgi:hypothetical protein
MKNLLTFTIFTFLGLASVHAQQVDNKDEKSSMPVIQTEIKKLPRDTVIRSQSGKILKEIEQEGAELKDQLIKNTAKKSIEGEIKSTQEGSGKITAPGQAEQIGKDIKKDAKGLKSDAAETKDGVKQAGKETVSDVKNISKQDKQNLMEDKATKLQYDSENPDDAPWKKNPLSDGDIKDQKSPLSLKGNISDKPEEYADKLKNASPGSKNGKGIGEMFGDMSAGNLKFKTLSHVADSISSLKDKVEFDNLQQQLLGSKKIYSDKYIKRVYDSLGLEKGDSIFKVASALVKTETPKEELLNKLNSSRSGKEMKGVGLDSKNESLKMDDADKLNGLQDQISSKDISQLKLPDSLLAGLAPLRGRKLDSKYLPVIDSMKDVVLKAKNRSLDERQITEEVKRSVMKKKPRFTDKIYFEGILGLVNDSTFKILEISPSLGYHFTKSISVGLGPNLLLQLQEKKLSMLVGFRSYVKAEIWKQRMYLQIEDNVSPQPKINNESLRAKRHAVLAGGGGLLPITKKLALNLAVLYQINKDITNPGRSPWVIRVGISSIKKVNP